MNHVALRRLIVGSLLVWVVCTVMLMTHSVPQQQRVGAQEAPTMTPTASATAEAAPEQLARPVYLPLIQQGQGTAPTPEPPLPPPSTISRYFVLADEATLFNWGRADAQRTGSTRGITVLLFGQPAFEDNLYGVQLLDDETFAPAYDADGSIERAVAAYIRGYWSNTQTGDPLRRIAIGTSNLGPLVAAGDVTTQTHAQEWATLVEEIDGFIERFGYGSRINVIGASNIELNWNTYEDTWVWVESYIDTTNIPLVNVGACEGCPRSDRPNVLPDNGWTLENIWTVSNGAGRLVLPQIYADSGVNARQWQYISEARFRQEGTDMLFSGSLTQLQACLDRNDPCTDERNSPDQGWTQLWQALNSDPDTVQPILTTSSDIRWER